MEIKTLILASISVVLLSLPLTTSVAESIPKVAIGGRISDQSSIWLPESLQATYQHDDGTTEGFVVPLLNGSTDQPAAIFLVQFTVIPGQNVFSSIAVAWGSMFSGSRPAALNGRPVTLGIWSDPDNDGQPYDAELLGWVDAVVSEANTDQYVSYTFNHPVTIADDIPNNFFLGFKTPTIRHDFSRRAGYSFAGVDLSSSSNKSWVVWNDPNANVQIRHPGENSLILRLDDLTGGNLMIRSDF